MVLITLPQGISSFSLFSLLHIRVNGLMGMSFSLKLSISLSLSEDWKQMRVSFFETLFETLSDYLALSYHFINICPCFLLYLMGVDVGEIQLIVFYCIVIVNFFDWLLWLGAMGLVWVGGGGWMGTWGRGGIFELGEVNAHGVCASATNKQ